MTPTPRGVGHLISPTGRDVMFRALSLSLTHSAQMSSSCAAPRQRGGGGGGGGVTHLDGGGAPLDEVGQLALADALQALVHLRRIHLALRVTAVLPFVMSSPASLACSATPGKTAAREKMPIAGLPGSSNKVEGVLPGRFYQLAESSAKGSEVPP